MDRLTGKTVLVTGASSGIGRAVALSCAQAGADVALVARSRGALEEVARLVQEAGGRAVVCVADVGDEAQILAAVDEAHRALGPIHVLVNNAGMNVTERTIRDTSSQQWRQLMEVNLTSAFLFTKAILPEMIERGGGTIINLASRSTLHPGLLGGVAYSASKQGMDALTQITNEEANAHGVRACMLCPGTVNTPIVDRRSRPPSPTERQHLLQPEDVAEVVLLMASLPPRVNVELVSMVQTVG
ncbi:MAG: SDR family NAD(P)-dependent oxidoreductase [Caldilineaceae bacterium]|nr:SDR family NAD(P)-dependent oxidoreductase [Caldilineaceae bacterium]MBP8108119.1 SDR family NAD(P)-dependent oxidoreductase [Caldilineaceae bacterium]MBP8123079.1 SDR family NAD(P)-dependent oxidoreductase [Caldilineaceae bacterium]MBP9070726.1 SDR family NAD(P)-dependent oxidoreductase [Caldilineaceae bacterium]